MGYSPWGRKELDATERLTLLLSFFLSSRASLPAPHDIPTSSVITWSDRMQTLALLSSGPPSYLLTPQPFTEQTRMV